MGPTPRLRRAGFWIAYLTAILLTAFAALEGTTRLLGLAPDVDRQFRNFVADPYLPYRPRPDSVNEGRSASGEFDFRYAHNRQGLRDVERPVEKPAGVFRVLGLGDSFTYGVGVPFEQTYLARLERILADRSGDQPRVEIVKAGIPRFFTLPERIFLERYGLAYRPDLVLVAVVPNDVLDTHLGIDQITVDESGYLKTREARELGAFGSMLYLRSHFARNLLQRWVTAKIAERFDPRPEEVYREGGYHESDWRAVERELARMIELARSGGARIAFVYIPQKELSLAAMQYPAGRLARFLEAYAAPLIDTLPPLREASDAGPLYYPLDGHCTPAGHAVIAETLAAELPRLGLLPGSGAGAASGAAAQSGVTPP